MANIYVRSTDGLDTDTGATWALAKATLAGAAAIDAAGDTVYVSNAHSESTNAAITLAFVETLANPVRIICGNDAAEPPTAVATSAVVATGNGAQYNIVITGSLYCYGISFRAAVGNTANSSFIYLANTTTGSQNQVYENCTFDLATTLASATPRIQIGVDGAAQATPQVLWKNCQAKLGNALHSISLQWVDFTWKGGSIGTGSAAVTTLFKTAGTARTAKAVIDGVDLTNAAATVSLVDVTGIANASYVFRDCKLPATWTGTLTTGTFVMPAQRVSMYNCDSADTNYRLWIETYAGNIKSETTIVRTGGASDGTTTLSWKMASSASANYLTAPLVSDEIPRWNDTVAATVTATVEIVHDSQGAGAGAAFTNEEVWLEVMYLGTSGVPLGSFISNAKADVLATAADQATSTATWTTTGLTTPVKQKLSITFTPQEKGFMLAKVHLGKASKTLYVDPKITVS